MIKQKAKEIKLGDVSLADYLKIDGETVLIKKDLHDSKDNTRTAEYQLCDKNGKKTNDAVFITTDKDENSKKFSVELKKGVYDVRRDFGHKAKELSDEYHIPFKVGVALKNDERFFKIINSISEHSSDDLTKKEHNYFAKGLSSWNYKTRNNAIKELLMKYNEYEDNGKIKNISEKEITEFCQKLGTQYSTEIAGYLKDAVLKNEHMLDSYVHKTSLNITDMDKRNKYSISKSFALARNNHTALENALYNFITSTNKELSDDEIDTLNYIIKSQDTYSLNGIGDKIRKTIDDSYIITEDKFKKSISSLSASDIPFSSKSAENLYKAINSLYPENGTEVKEYSIKEKCEKLAQELVRTYPGYLDGKSYPEDYGLKKENQDEINKYTQYVSLLIEKLYKNDKDFDEKMIGLKHEITGKYVEFYAGQQPLFEDFADMSDKQVESIYKLLSADNENMDRTAVEKMFIEKAKNCPDFAKFAVKDAVKNFSAEKMDYYAGEYYDFVQDVVKDRKIDTSAFDLSQNTEVDEEKS